MIIGLLEELGEEATTLGTRAVLVTLHHLTVGIVYLSGKLRGHRGFERSLLTNHLEHTWPVGQPSDGAVVDKYIGLQFA